MSDESKRSCASCGKPLRAHCKKDTCSNCRGEGLKAGAPRSAKVPRAKASKPVPLSGDVLSNFRLVTAALGFDSDELLASFAEEWLKQVREQVGQ